MCNLGCEETESYWSNKGWSYLSTVLEDKWADTRRKGHAYCW